jgi:hypothetical protein
MIERLGGKKRRRVAAWAVMMVGLGVLSACGSSDDGGGPPAEDLGDAGDAAGDACTPVGPQDGGTFACGSLACTAAEYCKSIPGASMYECLPIPRSCGPCPTCDCLPSPPVTGVNCACSALGGGFKFVCK